MTAFDFLTVLLCIHSTTIVLLLCICEDELELRYKLHSGRDVETLRSRVINVADGRLHTVIVRRLADIVSVQVNTNTREIFLTLSYRFLLFLRT